MFILEINLPYEPVWFGLNINIHLVLEYLAFFVGFRYYVLLRKRVIDAISQTNRLSILIGAIFGALLFSRVFAFLENPIESYNQGWISILNSKTIMGGLFGGLIGVELMKKGIGEKQSSGNLFTLPIILGIIIGRIGCFFKGVDEFTYGKVTTSFLGLDLGDGLLRHPIALYEIAFLLILFVGIKKAMKKSGTESSGAFFKFFMISYFSFRFLIEFLKPNTFLNLGLSSIQYLCLLCLLYYTSSIKTGLKYAYKRLHLL